MASELDHARASMHASKWTANALVPEVAAAYIDVPSIPVWLAKGPSAREPWPEDQLPQPLNESLGDREVNDG